MNRTIWKFDLQVAGRQVVNVPNGAKLLTIQMQHGRPVLWAEVNPDEPHVAGREILCFGTGHPITPKQTYLGTVQEMGGNLVWHFYERTT